MFFRKRKSAIAQPVPQHSVANPDGLEPLLSKRKYKTNYDHKKGTKHRESPRCKSQRKEEIGEYKIEVELRQLPPAYQLLSNLLIPTEQGLEHIDHLIVSPYGLFIFEVNNRAGIILGEETDPRWYQSITWRVKTFINPLWENQKHIEMLRERVKLDPNLPVTSYVTFSRRCDLKVVSGSVFYDTDIPDVIRKRSKQEVLRVDEVSALYQEIKQLNLPDAHIRTEYAVRLRKERLRQRPQYGDIRCRICQKPVSERTARYCIHHPDKFAWQIYCVKHQKELTTFPRVERKTADC